MLTQHADQQLVTSRNTAAIVVTSLLIPTVLWYHAAGYGGPWESFAGGLKIPSYATAFTSQYHANKPMNSTDTYEKYRKLIYTTFYQT